jgi:NAD(P)-dependent dehydrogenase (short-subunit alcohol dehydrogenase family)
MDLQLNGKTALVTGSTLGIGYAIARQLAREGVHVIVNGRGVERVSAAVSKLRGEVKGASVTGVAADVSTSEGVAEVARNATRVDILVNNMGIFEPREFGEIPDSEWMRFFDVNVMSGVRLSREYLKGMLERNWGRIVFISSESGLQIPKEMIHYGVTKTAQIALARGLAELTAGTGVTVNSVLPGPTKSEGVEEFVDKLSAGQSFEDFEKEFFKVHRATSLLQRFATVDEVSPLVALVCSPLGAAINGAALRVEGGIVKSAF